MADCSLAASDPKQTVAPIRLEHMNIVDLDKKLPKLRLGQCEFERKVRSAPSCASTAASLRTRNADSTGTPPLRPVTRRHRRVA